MKYFPHAPNLYINGDGYLKGFLGLDWLPSDAAKAQVDNYEKKVAALLFGMWKSYTASWVMWEITVARPKRVDIKPPEFAPDEFKENKSGSILPPRRDRRTGTTSMRQRRELREKCVCRKRNPTALRAPAREQTPLSPLNRRPGEPVAWPVIKAPAR